MNSLDGIIRTPKGFKHEARRLITLVFMLAPIGIVGAVMATQGDGGQSAARSTVAPSVPPKAAVPLPTSLQTPVIGSPNSSQQANTSIELHTNQTSPTQAPVTKVRVDQQAIDIPPDGSVHRVMSTNNGTTTLDVTSSTSGSSDTSTSSSTNIQLNTSSTSSTNSQTDTGP